MYVFGPIQSRRLGLSLGINNIPHKFCSYSCIYCQIGRTAHFQVNRKPFYNPEDIVSEVKKTLLKLERAQTLPEYITIVPDGEPTLDIHLGSLIEKLKRLGFPVAVITNGSLVQLSDVQQDLAHADYISVKMDSVKQRNETCPQEANPGELMMSLRRWLTTKYDWTGLAGILYKSLPITMLAFSLIIVGVIGFSVYENFNEATIMHYGHLFEIIAICAVFLLILLPNIIRMWWLTMSKINATPLTYGKEFKELIVHMFTQKRTRDCENNDLRWLEHLFLVIAYLVLFTTVALDWFGTDSLLIILIGYVASAIIFIVTFDFIIRRVKKEQEISKYSHSTDWLFIIWLFLMGFTAFLVRIFIDIHILEENLWLYLVHLIILVQWALIIVPFGKWTHFIYRSFAMYFNSVKTISQVK